MFVFVFGSASGTTLHHELGWGVRHGVDGPRQWEQQEAESDSKRVLAHGNAPFHPPGTAHAGFVFQKKKDLHSGPCERY